MKLFEIVGDVVMYCVRVNPGSERIRVRQFEGGILPSYTHVGEQGKLRGKRFVVPGFVFTQQKVPGAIAVPENEWKMIDAISDQKPSILDHTAGRIVEGPLKVAESDIKVVEADRIKVLTRILGENRAYWLAVQAYEPDESVPSEETSAPEHKDAEPGNHKDAIEKAKAAANAEEMVKSARNTGETVKAVGTVDKNTELQVDRDMSEKGKQKVEYTPEQEAEMIARSEKVGIQLAAKEYSVPWQVIAGMKRRANAKNNAKEAPAARKDEPGRKAGKEKKAAVTAKAAPVKKSVAAKAVPAKNVATVSGMKALPSAEVEALKVENAVLRERLSKLEAQVAKLQKCIKEMI